jgi:cell wall assembly regulator SMI1
MQASSMYDSFWLRVESCLKAHAPELHTALNPPTTEHQLRAVEAEIGYPLHPELRAAYLRHDGIAHRADGTCALGTNFDLFGPMGEWVPVGLALSDWRELKEYNIELRKATPELFPELQDCWKDLVIKPVSWSEGHFPIGRTGTSYRVFVDMEPAGKGCSGQVFGDDGMIEQRLFAPSFNTFMGAIADHLESGAVRFSMAKHGLYAVSTGRLLYRLYPELVS